MMMNSFLKKLVSAKQYLPAPDITKFFNNLVELHQQNLENKKDLKKLDVSRDILVTEIQLKYDLYEKVLFCIYKEREMVIKKNMEVIDEGIKNKNEALILQGLINISDIVVKSPLKDLSLLKKAIDSNENIIL